MRKIKMEKIAEVIRLHFKLDLSVRQTSSALNIARSSVGDYCQKFKSLNLDIVFIVCLKFSNFDFRV